MDPALGRFTTPDPIRDFVNPYSYVRNNPVNAIDPTGMESYNVLWGPTSPIPSQLDALFQRKLWELTKEDRDWAKQQEERIRKNIQEQKKEEKKARDQAKKIKEKKIKELKTVANTWDAITNKRILTLDPRLQLPATEFINAAADKGIDLRISWAYRSIEEQDQMYASGRTIEGDILTNAPGGKSPHNFGLAIDVIEIKDGIANWEADWNTIGTLGESFGFEWGGRWKRFPDRPHFQMYWPR